jgi:UMP-CMP kinase
MDGKIVPVRITVNLIKKAMIKAGMNLKFLIDGFPRSDDNVQGWWEVMGDLVDLAGVLHFDADEEVMQ